MKTSLLFTLVPAVGLLITSGCVPIAEGTKDATTTVVTGHEGGAYAPVNSDRYDLENRSKFVLLDHSIQRAVTCSGLFEKFTDDGRLEITANVRNRVSRRLNVQINCVFKDAQGAPTGDETPFQTLILTENAQEGVKFTSMNNLAKGYTIRVREAR